MIDYLIIIAIVFGCSMLNHLGGQSTVIPYNRITCRVFGVGALIAASAALLQFDLHLVLKIWAAVTAGQAIWATFKWGPMFMAVDKNNGIDARVYTDPWYMPNSWITRITDRVMGFSQYTPINAAQKRTWGMIYGTFRGMLIIPTFIALAIILTPVALFGGAVGLFQGIVYRLSYRVLEAEYKYGAAYGIAYAAVLLMKKHFY